MAISLVVYQVFLIRNRILGHQDSKISVLAIMRSRLEIIWKSIKERKERCWWDWWAFWLAIIGRFGVPLFAFSTQKIDTAIATILLQSYVLWLVLFDYINKKINNKKELDNEIDEENSIPKRMRITLIILGFFGLTFVILSGEEISTLFINVGFIWALLGAGLDALNVDRSIKFGVDTTKIYDENNTSINDKNSDLIKDILKREDKETLNTLIPVALASLSVGVFGIFLLLSNNTFGHLFDLSLPSYSWIIVMGFVLHPIAIIFTRKGNISRRNEFVEVNAVAYFGPVFALLYLFLFTSIDIVRLDYFLIGTLIVFAINFLLNVKTRQTRWGLRGLVISLWIAGVLTYMRDELWYTMRKGLWKGILGDWFTSNWQWNDSTDYFALLGLSATIFILVLSFSRLRLSELIQREEGIALEIFWKFGLLKKYKIEILNEYIKTRDSDNLSINIEPQDEEALAGIMYIDQLTPRDMSKKEKEKFEKSIKGLEKSIDSLDSESTELEEADIISNKADLITKLDLLKFSKSKGRDILELIVLAAFSSLTIFIALGTRPYFEEWNGFIFDVFSMLFASVIAFLTLNFLDIQRQRGTSVFKDESFQRKRWVDIILPIILCLFIGVIFMFLFYGKWFKGSNWSWASEVAPVTTTLPDCPPTGRWCAP